MLSIDEAKAELARRYGAPTRSRGDYVVAHTLPDGRAIAVEAQGRSVRLWVEDDRKDSPVPAAEVVAYHAAQGRNTNLPARLAHNPPKDLQAQGFPKPVLKIMLTTPEDLRAVLDWYGSSPMMIDRDALEQMKARFLAAYPDFEGHHFGASTGQYWNAQRAPKQPLIDQAQAAFHDAALSNEELGKQLFAALITNDFPFVGWGMTSTIQRLLKEHPGVMEAAAGKLVRSEPPFPAAVSEFVERIWPLFVKGNEHNLPYGDIRAVPTLLLALARPTDAVGVRYQIFNRAGQRLLKRSLFANAPLSASEYADVLAMAEKIQAVMRNEWGWEPRDLWDVYGFIAAACRSGKEASTAVDDEEEDGPRQPAGAPEPVNLILYGPPGTGKTFTTTRRAVELCDGSAPSDPAELKQRYDELRERKRIEFVTFHQSYGYEEFVEGLRPETGADGEENGAASAGFRLVPKPGVFRRIADRANANRGSRATTATKVEGRQAFKMSLGNTGDSAESYLFDECIKNGYVLLGYGGEIDWSAPEYDAFEEIKKRWRVVDPEAKGNDGNIQQVYALRSYLKQGDLVVVSNGNSRFRAIGEVTGPYQFVPRSQDEYHHRRPVKWHWFDRGEGLPREDIYGKQFSMVSIYRLVPNLVNWPALQQVIDGAATNASATPEPYVLIIDEINRGNVSRVFGELITLLEKDRRIGKPDAVEVTLPYSGSSFGVPSNLHIIGTMNTADRSIALLDTALRRRFDFEELMPRPELLTVVDGIDLGAVLSAINSRIEFLFDRDHQIGHAYFMKCRSRAAIEVTMRRQIIPLLVEYFYEDWEKVRATLNETDDDGAFISRVRLTAPRSIGSEYNDAERWRYQVKAGFADDAFDRLIG